MARLRQSEGIAARCLEFAVLTAARTGEVIGAQWPELDLEHATWIVPAARMKGGEQHVVFLSGRALVVLESLRGMHKRWLFPSPMVEDQPISNMAMLTMLDRFKMRDRTTVHGLCRATFSTWAHETAAARPDVIEACLAHREADKVKAAYNRAQFNDERRALLAKWATYLSKTAEVVPMRAA
jgi:integrase